MTTEEAKSVLRVLSSAYPREQVREHTVSEWARQLAPIDGRDGLEAAARIVREDKWFPSFARFAEVASGERQRREARESSGQPLPDWPARFEEGLSHVQSIRREHFQKEPSR